LIIPFGQVPLSNYQKETIEARFANSIMICCARNAVHRRGRGSGMIEMRSRQLSFVEGFYRRGRWGIAALEVRRGLRG
jgi:hypothetical protein